MVVPFLQVVPDPLVVLLLDVERVVVVVAGDRVLQSVSVLELEQVHVDRMPQHGGAAGVLSHQLNKLLEDALHVLVCLVSDEAVCIEINKKLHPFTLGQRRLAHDRQHNKVPGQNSCLFLVNVNV